MKNNPLSRIGVIMMLLALLVYLTIYILNTGNYFEGQQLGNSLTYNTLLFVFGLAMFLYNRSKEDDYEDLTFEEKCERLALELKENKRRWFFVKKGKEEFAYPLAPSNLREFGGSSHFTATLEEVEKSIALQEIKNVDQTKKIIEISKK